LGCGGVFYDGGGAVDCAGWTGQGFEAVD